MHEGLRNRWQRIAIGGYEAYGLSAERPDEGDGLDAIVPNDVTIGIGQDAAPIAAPHMRGYSVEGIYFQSRLGNDAEFLEDLIDDAPVLHIRS